MASHSQDRPLANSQLDADALLTFRSMLLAARAARENAADENVATAYELARQGATDSFLERDLADASAVRAQEDVAEIAAALARIDAGTYGSCETCGLPINPQRLEVIPEARLCVTCSAGGARTFPQQAVRSGPSVMSAKMASPSLW